MDINPYDTRQRILQAQDQVQVQREVAPDAELAGCPGCPYFWTCPVPHRGEEVRPPREIHLEDVTEEIGERRPFRPHDESDIGWTDVWIEDDEDGAAHPTEDAPTTSSENEKADVEGAHDESAAESADSGNSADSADTADTADAPSAPDHGPTSRRRWWQRRSRRG
ncbi:hypothetical protein Bra3105_07815 [Brachybacterium halotolerans subsp. kimchii]|uniref:hypothetical protein n=1 Tax=Brachybacterium halotolerans TaxID=2795215 RepID=UPI001E448641|nr:hypothetical protein [Brachybacterium halotolerans]UEJ84198.1 hypothetical protein Bra3105_07815 [Brachybacterium halotolerans subsp. kimchii]